MKRKIITALFVLMVCFITSAYAIDNVEFLTSDPSPIVAGDYADLTLKFSSTFTQNALTHDTVVITVGENPYLELAENNNITLTKVLPGEIYTRTLRVYVSDKTPQGQIDLPIFITLSGTQIKHLVRIYVQEAESIPEIAIGSIKTTPDELLLDSKDNKFTITLQNLGEKDAELVSAKMTVYDSEFEPSYAFSDTDSVSSINSGEQADLEFTFDIGFPKEKLSDAQLQLQYRVKQATSSNYETYTHLLKFAVPLSKAPFFEVLNVEQVDEFKQGSADNIIRVQIKNTGDGEAKDVRVRAIPDISYPFIFTLTTQYISSTIKPGDTATIEYKAEVSESAQIREFPIVLKLESLAGEARYEQEIEMSITPIEAKKASSNSIAFVVIIIIVLVSSIIGFTAWRKKR